MFFSSRRRHTRFKCDCSSDVCSSDLREKEREVERERERKKDRERGREKERVRMREDQQMKGNLVSFTLHNKDHCRQQILQPGPPHTHNGLHTVCVCLCGVCVCGVCLCGVCLCGVCVCVCVCVCVSVWCLSSHVKECSL